MTSLINYKFYKKHKGKYEFDISKQYVLQTRVAVAASPPWGSGGVVTIEDKITPNPTLGSLVVPGVHEGYGPHLE